ncbi:MAG TPA: asparagine synthase (glutamine-hydrolyzing) [Chitinophagaceae bacterium]|jgi:asparagine synthase (glutamine-hydrolysing)|nr:asparagine synthase (glutamine-hydrolyzing) [Chitinophagaceae bacterium]
MCGIAGIFHFDTSRKADDKVVKSMTDSLSHRGPDGEGFFIHNNIALGHRRLSIIDLETGDQPMFNEDHSIVVIFNGEIYNYIELREELKTLGHTFRTKSDTEVIIKAYQQWGLDCQNKFNGMWAFALWDEKQQQLFLSRDRIGEKPIFYSVFENTLVFGSEIKSLFAYGVPNEYNLELLEIYLTLSFIPAPHTFYKDIFKLEAGHCLLVTSNSITKKQFWDLPKIDESNMWSEKKKIYEQFEYLLKDSIKLRMRCDVPYGAFLSGGLDSSSIVTLMSEISSFPVETFTIGYHEKPFDERELAKLVANECRTNHHEILVKHDSFAASLDNIAYHFDEPFGDASAIATGQVSKFASEKVKMILTGDGGDEILSGYRIYQGEKFAAQYRNLPAWVRKSIPNFFSVISKPFDGHAFNYPLKRIQRVTNSSNLDFKSRFLSKTVSIDIDLIKQMTNGTEKYPVEEFLGDFLKKCSYKDPFYKLMYLNHKLTLPDDMLVKTDRMSMAHSIEIRTPFLDYRLIEYMAGVHKDVKMINFERKSVLRHTVGRKLPKGILKAPKKGFSVPLRYWLKNDSFKKKLQDLEKDMDFLSKNRMETILKKNITGREDDGNFIWKLFVLSKTIAASVFIPPGCF